MKTVAAAFAATFLLACIPAQAQPQFTCQQVREQSCSQLRWYAYWYSVPVARQINIARRCGVQRCLAQ